MQGSVAVESRQIKRFTEIEKMFVQVEYVVEDLKASILTTDTYLENYLPHKMEQRTHKLLAQLYNGGQLPSKDDQAFGENKNSLATDADKFLYL